MAGSLLTIFLIAAGGAAGQECSELSFHDRGLAEDLAPTLRFAGGERYFPTGPFFNALDLVDNDEDGVFDFEDEDEVWPYPADGPADWMVLDSVYQANPPGTTVFYRVRELEPQDVTDLWRFLRNDPRAWVCTEASRFHDRWEQRCQRMMVTEYYFYYLDDRGISGHLEDIEFVFVFSPLDPNWGDGESFRVVVGAAHGPRIPNNVLFQSGRQLPEMGVLVELGGHASAPDVPPYGLFEMGIDVNWQVNSAWGVRDNLSLLGTGLLEAYQPGMTTSRENGLTLGPEEIGRSAVPTLGASSNTNSCLSNRLSTWRMRSRMLTRWQYSLQWPTWSTSSHGRGPAVWAPTFPIRSSPRWSAGLAQA